MVSLKFQLSLGVCGVGVRGKEEEEGGGEPISWKWYKKGVEGREGNPYYGNGTWISSNYSEIYTDEFIERFLFQGGKKNPLFNVNRI